MQSPHPQPVSPIVVPFDGVGELLLRPLTNTDDDRARCHKAFELLSPEARMSRFWTRSLRVSEKMVTRLIAADQVNDVVWAAIDPHRPWIPGLGGASFWRDPLRPERAEFSVTIADSYQNRGLGTLVLALVWIIARQRGVTEFVSHIRPENQASRHWLGAMGGTSRAHTGEIVIRWPLVSAQALINSSSKSRRAIGRRMVELEPLLFPDPSA